VNESQAQQIRSISKSPSWPAVEALLEECVRDAEREALRCKDASVAFAGLMKAQGARDLFDVFKRAVEDSNGGFDVG
jgi:hypothetical protein